MTDLPGHIAGNIRAHKLLRPGSAVLVAVSGGVDSMVLLHALHQLAAASTWRLTVAHFNHRLRGRASAADARLVRAAARRLNLRCLMESADVRSAARQHGISLEMAARELRHAFLVRAAREAGAASIALAHHADDQVELFFVRLLRGAGSDGLAGMKWKNPSPQDRRITLVRPVLDVSKRALASFAAANQVPFRADASNDSLDFVRNRIRHELIPLLERHYQPALPRIVARHMDLASAESEFLNRQAAQWLNAGHAAGFDELPPALQRRVLQQQLHALGVAADLELVERLRTTADGTLSVAADRQVRRDDAGRMRVLKPTALSFAGDRRPLRLEGRCGSVQFGSVSIRWSIRRHTPGQMPRRSDQSEWFDADRIGSTVVLCHWQPGDRFQPIGMPQAVKLQDLFTNLKVSARDRRQRVVAVAASGEIFWVEALRISENFKLTDATRRRLEWRWKRSADERGRGC